MTAGRAWAVLGAAVAVYELAADDDQLLTRGVRRARSRHPVLNVVVVGGIVVTAAHLLDALPPVVDPYRLLHVVRIR